MDFFVFLWIYFAVSLFLSIVVYALYLLLQKYGKLIRRSDAAKATVSAALLAASLTFLWYSISTTLTIFNKWLMTRWHGGFEYPLLTSSVHMFMKLIVSRIWLLCNPAVKISPDSWKTYIWLVVPIGALTSIDISLSNASLIYIPVSLYTTVKSSVLIYTYLFSVFFELEQPRLKTFLSIMAIMVGLSVAVLATKHISLYGVALCLAASFSGGLRWVVMQYFMKLHMSGHSVMATLYKISPIAFLSLLPMAVMIEGNSFMKSEFMVLDPSSYSLQYLIVLFSLFGGLLASVLIFVEMVLLAVTSSMTLTVLGQVKEIIQIVLSMMVFNENLSTRSICGITFSLIAANSYRQIKMQEIRDEADRNLGVDADDKDSDDDVELLIPKNGIIGRQVSSELSNGFDDAALSDSDYT